jgi:hypothetical protein
MPTERPPLVGEVIANFCGLRLPRGQRDGSLRPYSRFSRQEPLLFYNHTNFVRWNCSEEITYYYTRHLRPLCVHWAMWLMIQNAFCLFCLFPFPRCFNATSRRLCHRMPVLDYCEIIAVTVQVSVTQIKKQTPWPESASKLYLPRYSLLSAKLVSTLADRGCLIIRAAGPLRP